MENLPSEILSLIFSYMDKISLKSVTATCKLWFVVIRKDSKSSNHIYHKNSFEVLQNRMGLEKMASIKNN